jgi:hypothetical protein
MTSDSHGGQHKASALYRYASRNLDLNTASCGLGDTRITCGAGGDEAVGTASRLPGGGIAQVGRVRVTGRDLTGPVGASVAPQERR